MADPRDDIDPKYAKAACASDGALDAELRTAEQVYIALCRVDASAGHRVCAWALMRRDSDEHRLNQKSFTT